MPASRRVDSRGTEPRTPTRSPGALAPLEPVGNQIRSGGFRKWKGDLRRAARRALGKRSDLARTSSRSAPAGIGDAAEVGQGLEIGATVARVRTEQQPS